MKPLIQDKGMDEYQGVKAAQEKAKTLLKELADTKAYIEEHQAGAEWLRLEDKDKFDATQKAVDEALITYVPSAFERFVTGSEAIAEYQKLLKNPLFYDASCRQWNWYTTQDGKLEDNSTYRLSVIQLEGIIALALTAGKAEASKVYDLLLETPLRDKPRKQWNNYMDAAQQIKDSDRLSESQLTGIIALASLGRMKEANEEYDLLLETPLRDKPRKQWNNSMDAAQQMNNSGRLSEIQLSGIIALASIGRMKEANEEYNALVETPLRNKEKKQWNNDMDAAQQMKDSDRRSLDQLTGVIALASLGRMKEANEEYNALVETSLYNKGQWAVSMDKNGKIANGLTGIYIYLYNVIALAALGR